jgi:hypothetical protein
MCPTWWPTVSPRSTADRPRRGSTRRGRSVAAPRPPTRKARPDAERAGSRRRDRPRRTPPPPPCRRACHRFVWPAAARPAAKPAHRRSPALPSNAPATTSPNCARLGTPHVPSFAPRTLVYRLHAIPGSWGFLCGSLAARHCSEHPSGAWNARLAEQLRVKSPLAPPGQADATHLHRQVAAFRSRPLDAGPYMFVRVDAHSQGSRGAEARPLPGMPVKWPWSLQTSGGCSTMPIRGLCHVDASGRYIGWNVASRGS